jgi:hypothetical protein
MTPEYNARLGWLRYHVAAGDKLVRVEPRTAQLFLQERDLLVEVRDAARRAVCHPNEDTLAQLQSALDVLRENEP